MRKPNFHSGLTYAEQEDYLTAAMRLDLHKYLPRKMQKDPALRDRFFDDLNQSLQAARQIIATLRNAQTDQMWGDIREASTALHTALAAMDMPAVHLLDLRYGYLLYNSKGPQKLPRRHATEQPTLPDVLSRLWDDIEALRASIAHAQSKARKRTNTSKRSLEGSRALVRSAASAAYRVTGWPGPTGWFHGFTRRLFDLLQLGELPGPDLLKSGIDQAKVLRQNAAARTPRGIDSLS